MFQIHEGYGSVRANEFAPISRRHFEGPDSFGRGATRTRAKWGLTPFFSAKTVVPAKAGTQRRLFGQCAICLEHALNRFVQIVPDLIQSRPLRIGPRKLFYEADKSLRNLLEDGGKFHGRLATASQGRFDQAILCHFKKRNDLITRDARESIEKIVD
jgi:hypothetical protein